MRWLPALIRDEFTAKMAETAITDDDVDLLLEKIKRNPLASSVLYKKKHISVRGLDWQPISAAHLKTTVAYVFEHGRTVNGFRVGQITLIGVSPLRPASSGLFDKLDAEQLVRLIEVALHSLNHLSI